MGKALTFEGLLDKLAASSDGPDVSVGQLLLAVGRRSYGPILLLLGFASISPLTIVPGANWLFALITLVISAQIVIGRGYPWVPRRLLSQSVQLEHVCSAVKAARPWARAIDSVLRPRLEVLTEAPFVQLVGLACVAAALVTFPLGLIPFGPVLPGLAVMFFGLGLAGRDGLFLILSGFALTGSIFLLTQVADRISGIIGRII